MTCSPESQYATASDDRDGAEAAYAAADACILALYRELLQREPAAAERAEWRAVLLGGGSPAAVRDAFLASDEYRQLQATEQRKAAVAATGLFDADWYLATYRDVAEAGLDPLEHYCRYGAAEQRLPNAYFDAAWYAARADLPEAADALLDYAGRGEQLGLAPGPHFDPVWYRDTYGLDAGASPLAHFLAHRHGEFAPCPRLWSVARRASIAVPPDAADPFLPYLAPGEDLAQAAAPDIDLLRSSGLFDENHYQIISDDVFLAGMDLLQHYCLFGWQEGRNPNFYFDTRWYLATNPAVARLGVNPLVHYLLVGEAADRRPVVFFDPGWYRRTYGLGDDVSPLAHYLAHRRSQQFSPNPLFDPAFYCSQNPAAANPRRDLFAHYLMAGMRSDVRPSADFDAAAWRRRTRGRPSRHFRQSQSPERDNPLVTYLLAHYQ